MIDKVTSVVFEQDLGYPYISKERRPDTKWLLDVLSTIKPGDEIFRKDYVPPPKRKGISDVKSITLPDHLFQDMPTSKSKAKRRGLKIVGEGLAKQKLQNLKDV